MKSITSGLDTKVNLRVSLHTAIMNFMSLRQYSDESNDTYLTRFKSVVETLKLAGGEHILVSPKIMGKELSAASSSEVEDEKQRLMAVYFILRCDEGIKNYWKI